jgi:hypothetical protein
MRRITACMAALISVLFVSTSVSVSACDLSCWLRQSQADCHSGVSMSYAENGMSMAASMAMPMGTGPDGMHQMMASDAGAGTLPDSSASLEIGMDHRLTPMASQPEMAAERFIELAKPGMSSTALPDHSSNLSSCTRETCSEISVAASPPRAGNAQPDFLRHALVRSSVATILWARGNWIKAGSPPLELQTEHLATILRL